ncbi:MAG: hypothetical protein LBB61_01085 [Treponema sp.]|nr:hypothetical protein [Treponema sp.]
MVSKAESDSKTKSAGLKIPAGVTEGIGQMIAHFPICSPLWAAMLCASSSARRLISCRDWNRVTPARMPMPVALILLMINTGLTPVFIKHSFALLYRVHN